jgi:hypothetical protein
MNIIKQNITYRDELKEKNGLLVGYKKGCITPKNLVHLKNP